MAVSGHSVPTAPSFGPFTDRRREPDFLEFCLEQIDGGQRRIGLNSNSSSRTLLIALEIVAILSNSHRLRLTTWRAAGWSRRALA